MEGLFSMVGKKADMIADIETSQRRLSLFHSVVASTY
jgi:hypothetical protein